jgi:hypothetical protein
MQEDFGFLQDRINKALPKGAMASPRNRQFVPMTIPDTPMVVSMTRELIKTTSNGRSFPVFQKEGLGNNDAGTAYRQLVEEVLKRASNR